VELLTEPFQFTFMQSALVASLLIALTCGILGVYVVLRRMAFIGDAVSHTAMPGLVAAYLNGWSLFGGALVAGVATALAIGWVSRRGVIREDTAIGVVFTGLFALGVMMMSATKSFRDVTSLLFGNVLGVTEEDILLIAVVTAIVCSTVLLVHKELELTSFDPVHAQVVGISADLVRYLLLVLLALAVVVGIQAVGVVLVSGLLITPAAAASLLTARLPRMMLLAVGIAFLSVTVGLYVSYYANVSAGAAIVLCGSLAFISAWAIHEARSALANRAGPSLA
jgi:manganese/iron transport system permease protein